MMIVAFGKKLAISLIVLVLSTSFAISANNRWIYSSKKDEFTDKSDHVASLSGKFSSIFICSANKKMTFLTFFPGLATIKPGITMRELVRPGDMLRARIWIRVDDGNIETIPGIVQRQKDNKLAAMANSTHDAQKMAKIIASAQQKIAIAFSLKWKGKLPNLDENKVYEQRVISAVGSTKSIVLVLDACK